MIRKLARGIYRHLLPSGAKNSLRLWTLLDAPDGPPGLIETFPESRVLVLAPHMDDEVIGCGGTLHLHALTGARITVVFLTDGSQSDPGMRARCASEQALVEAQAALTERRKCESRAAGALLGYDDLRFLDRPDGALRVDDALRADLVEIIASLGPDLIYFPSPLELHPDHWAAARLLASLVGTKDLPGFEVVNCRAYEAWTALLPNQVVDVSSVFGLKLDALRLFESQIEHVDYLHTTAGLNAYRAGTRQGKGYCEAFFHSTVQEHAALVAALEHSR